LRDLEKVYVCQSEEEQKVYANELFARLSPFAQAIVEWRWLGYSWRKIATHLDMDHTAVRRAYFRELEALCRALSQPGAFLMRLKLRGLSRPEARFEAWIVQRHQERVLEGNATAAGPCPDEAFLKDLAKKSKRIALGDPSVEHAANCPICMRQLLALRREQHSRWLRPALTAAVASCLLIAAVFVVLARRGTNPEQQIADLAAVPKFVDLWNAGTFRGDQPGPLQAVSLPAALVKVTIVLPRYSDPGRYAIAVTRDQRGKDLLAAASAAAIGNRSREEVSVYLDLRKSQPGAYFLSTTHERDQASYYYPLQIR
jgi:hypothetical protein